jgi:hypothetical protein
MNRNRKTMRPGWMFLAVLATPWVAACSAAPNGQDVTTSGSGGSSTSGSTDTTTGTGGNGAGGTGIGGELLSSGGSTASGGSGGAGGTGGAPCGSGQGGGAPGPTEICGNGIDDNSNGFIDEGCACDAGTIQPCYPGHDGLCTCEIGQQTCIVAGEFGQWGPCSGALVTCAGALDPTCEVCGNGVDDDCDGAIDEDCIIDLEVDIDGDCVTASCPPQAPYPISCNIVMSGNDSRGCVANAPGSAVVYFQEGDNCGAGHVTGTLQCSSQLGAPLSQANCPINKSDKFYPANKSDCP